MSEKISLDSSGMDKQNNSQVEVTNSDIKGNSNKMRIILIIIIIFAIICLVV